MAFRFDHSDEFGDMADINVTPLVDVMLVLLIIFMVTAPIIQQGVEVDLPKVKGAALPGSEQQFVVSITRGRDLYLNDARMTASDLTRKLTVFVTDVFGRKKPIPSSAQSGVSR